MLHACRVQFEIVELYTVLIDARGNCVHEPADMVRERVHMTGAGAICAAGWGQIHGGRDVIVSA